MSFIKTEKLSINDFDQICRLCSSENDLNPLYDNSEVLSMLEACTQMQFSVNDNLPNKICKKCSTKIQEVFDFINKCKNVDETYRKCLDDHFDEQYRVKEDEFILKEEPQKIPEQPQEFYTLQWDVNKEKPKSEVKTSEEISAVRRLQAAHHRLRCFRAKQQQQQVRETSDETTTTQRHRSRETAGCATQTATLLPRRDFLPRRDILLPRRDNLVPRRDILPRRDNLVPRRDNLVPRRDNFLPRSDNLMQRRCSEPPERIAVRRALAREQMRRFRSKLTVEEERAQLADNMRKYRARLSNEQIDLHRAQAREQMRRYRTMEVPPQTFGQFAATKITRPMCQEMESSPERMLRFRSWKRGYDCPEEEEEDAKFCLKHLCGLQSDDGTSRREQLRQFRTMKIHK